MVRIPIASVHDPQWGKDAPMIAAEVHFDGEVQAVNFLVDTGASSTSINSLLLANHVAAWNAGGEDGHCNGVGGHWPVKRHQNLELFFHLPSGDDISLQAPIVDLMAPFIDGSNRASMVAGRPGRRPARHQPCQTPNLLGRDFFRANGLLLVWDPDGEAYIEVKEETTGAPALDEQGQVN